MLSKKFRREMNPSEMNGADAFKEILQPLIEANASQVPEEVFQRN